MWQREVAFAISLIALGLVVACGDGNGGNKSCDGSNEQTGGTWTDSSSGLTWRIQPAVYEIECPIVMDTGPWQEAMDYCENLTWDGHSDWRLPTISELRSLIRGCPGTESGGSCRVTDRCPSYSSCWTEETCWACSVGGGPAKGCYWPDEIEGSCEWYWSSSYAGSSSSVWCVYFGNGGVGYGNVEADPPAYSYMRCVRGGP